MHRIQPERHFSTDHFVNRELSLLQFQRRVLAQAALGRPTDVSLESYSLERFRAGRLLTGRIESGRARANMAVKSMTRDGELIEQCLRELMTRVIAPTASPVSSRR